MRQSIRKMSLTLAAVGLLAASAVQAAELKIAVVDVRQIMAPEMKVIEAKLKKEFSKKEQELIALDKSFRTRIEKLQRDSAIMSAAERAKLEKEALGQQKEIQRLQAKLQEEGGKRQQEEMQKILDKIKRSVTQVAQQEKLDMVLDSYSIPYATSKFEITQKVMQVLKTKS